MKIQFFQLLKIQFLMTLVFISIIMLSQNRKSAVLRADDRVSPKAVLATSPSEGIRLSEKAVQTLHLEARPIAERSPGIFQIPVSSLVHSLMHIGVYRLRDGWFKWVKLGDISQSSSQDLSRQESTRQVLTRSKELKKGDQIVTEGAALLRVADMEAFSGDGE